MDKKVLVIDDSATVRQQVGLALAQSGFSVIEAVDGLDGIQQLNANPDVGLLVCDINMPNMNGLEMLERIQAEKHGGSIVPAIMLTTEGQPELVARAKKAGAKAWIVKPFKAELLVAAVSKLIRAA